MAAPGEPVRRMQFGPLDLWTSGPLDLWTSGPTMLLPYSLLVTKDTFLTFFLLAVRSPPAPSTPHNHGTSPPNCTSFGSGLLMGFMGFIGA